MTPILHATAELLALRFLDSLLEGTVICAFVAVVLRVMPRPNAAIRFAIWFSALVSIAVLPWLSAAWPHARVATTPTSASITLADSWAVYFLLFWAFFASLFCARLARAFWHMTLLRRTCTPVNSSDLDPVLQATLQKQGAKRGVSLCTSANVRVPTALGLVNPVIVIPNWTMAELSPAELNQLLLHELAHFHRWDDWTNLAQQVVKALFFFHPAVWWIDKRVAVEREMACDDAVVSQTSSPRAYAECLAHLAEKSFVNRSIALAQAALGKLRQTSDRVAEILNVNRPASGSLSWRAVATLMAAITLVCAVLYSRTPKIITFQTPARAYQSEVGALSANVAESASAPSQIVPAAETLNHRANIRKTSSGESAARRSRAPRLHEANKGTNLVHLARFTSAPVSVSETLWVIVKSDEAAHAGPQIYQIEMWRVTVLQTVTGSSNHAVLPKQI